MSDPGGGYGWRAGPYVPRRRAGVLALANRAEHAAPRDERPVGVILLPQPLEEFWLRERTEDLLTAPSVVAVDPARISYRALGRLPEPVMAGLAAGQARRMRFPGVPRAVLIFHPLQYPLARSLMSHYVGTELWYAHWSADEADPSPTPRLRRRLDELDTMASMRADWRFDPGEDAPGLEGRQRNRELYQRLERLGVESGRLGSERPDVIRAWRDASSPS